LPLPVEKMAVLVEMARTAVRVAAGAWEARHWELAWLEPTELMAMEATGAPQAAAGRAAMEEMDKVELLFPLPTVPVPTEVMVVARDFMVSVARPVALEPRPDRMELSAMVAMVVRVAAEGT